MIVVIGKSGISFRGAGRYFLHDKAQDPKLSAHQKPKTDERVVFTDTRNLANTLDPWMAIDEMWATADNQEHLKMASGQRPGGRRCDAPVKTISLNWHPSEKPSNEHMIATADAFLKSMGWQDHQAIYVRHNDTEHQHLHILINRVHPETGLTMNASNDRPRAQEWAKQYEREQGRIWCQGRLDPEQTKEAIPHHIIDATRDIETGYLKKQQQAERKEYFADGKKMVRELRDTIYADVREEYRQDWADYYADKAATLSRSQAASPHVQDDIMKMADKTGDYAAAMKALDEHAKGLAALEQTFKDRAAALKAEQTAETRQRQKLAVDELMMTRKANYQDLLRDQLEERHLMRAAHEIGESGAYLFDQPPYRTMSVMEPHQPIGSDHQAAYINLANEDAWTEPWRKASPAADREAPEKPEAASETRPPPEEEPRLGPQAGTQFEMPFEPGAPIRSPNNGIEMGLAGAIGSVASYLADQIAEFVAPTPPEVRERRAKQEAKREEEDRPKRAAKAEHAQNVFAATEQEARQRAQETDKARQLDFWDERERRKDR